MSRRIMRAALELTLEHGLEGWTMEDLATACEVSRRTLFNYYPTKLDAVMGPAPELPADSFEAFRQGLPTGDLIQDCRALARLILDEQRIGQAELRLHRQVMSQHPRMLLVLHQRFEQVASELVAHILAREGPDFGVDRAQMLVRLMVAVFDACLVTVTEEHEGRPFADLYDEALTTARELLT